MRLVGDILGGPWWCIAQFPGPFSYQTWDAARFVKKTKPPNGAGCMYDILKHPRRRFLFSEDGRAERAAFYLIKSH